jgi:hypothetical protein
MSEGIAYATTHVKASVILKSQPATKLQSHFDTSLWFRLIMGYSTSILAGLLLEQYGSK